MISDTALRMTGLTKTYPGGVTAVQNLNLSIGRGEIFGLLGPNGAGKTTTVRMICGLVGPSAGSIFVDGLSVADEPAAVRSRVGLLPEDAGDYRNLSLDEELIFHGALFGLSAATVRARSGPMIERLGLAARRRDRLKTFSRGMRRKFHLIRALLHRPGLLLLDEPTAGLDPAIVEDVWDLLKELATGHGVAIVLCSHHLEEVERLCGRIAILKQSLLIEGTLAELTAGGGRHRLLLANGAAGLLACVAGVDGVTEAGVDGDEIRFAVAGDTTVPAVVRAVVTAGGDVAGLTRDGRDLRSLYRSFVGTGASEQNVGEIVAAEAATPVG